MNNQTFLEMVKPWLAQVTRDALRMVGMYLLSKGFIQGGDAGVAAFIGAGMTLAGFAWGWFTTSGMVALQKMMKNVQTDIAKKAAPSASATNVVAKVLIAAFALSFLLATYPAMAAQPQTPQQWFEQLNEKLKADNAKLKADNANLQAKVKGAVTPSDATAALPCMDISVVTKLTPQNLVPTMKGCEIAGVNQLVSDTGRALDSAKAFTGSATSTSATGDNDAINCLAPALALFKAAAIVPAVPDTPAVLNADGTVKTPAVAGAPEVDPGPILLFQKYREFTIVGGLTSCQAWLNGPVNATAAAGLASVATAAGAAALIAPKP